MLNHLSNSHYPTQSSKEANVLESTLNDILEQDLDKSLLVMLAHYQAILADNHQRNRWPELHKKLDVLFKCGEAVALDGPFIGIPLSIRDSDYFLETARMFGRLRSSIARVEIMATAWNATFTDSGLWMGKTFEPVSKQQLTSITLNNADISSLYNEKTTRIGRNFFREPPSANTIQHIGLPALSILWNLKNRPMQINSELFGGKITQQNLDKEKAIPYTKTGGVYLAKPGLSIVPAMHGKPVYQLNYRWATLNPVYPMTKLIDEIVQIDDGIFLGQLVFATQRYSLGKLKIPLFNANMGIELGDAYEHENAEVDYGYQNNGFFLMMDTAIAKQIYADNAFPQLRPRTGEMGYQELGYGSYH